LADVKRADNKKHLILLKEKEMECKLVELEQAEKMEEIWQSMQKQLLRMQTDTTARIHETMQSLIPKKTPG
jgi:hypothetical protein